MDIPKKEETPKVYRVALPNGQVVLFVPCPRKLKGTRGHNPENHYARWRSPRRSLRRQLTKAGVILHSGRAWRRYKKDAKRMYRAYQQDATLGGMLDDATN